MWNFRHSCKTLHFIRWQRAHDIAGSTSRASTQSTCAEQTQHALNTQGTLDSISLRLTIALSVIRTMRNRNENALIRCANGRYPDHSMQFPTHRGKLLKTLRTRPLKRGLSALWGTSRRNQPGLLCTTTGTDQDQRRRRLRWWPFRFDNPGSSR